MIPRSCQMLIAAAALLAPPQLRREWTREWRAELWHKAEAGASAAELRRCARGAFRDAAWFRSSEFAPARRDDPFRKKPLRPELALLAVAAALCWATGALRAPELPFANARRLVRFQIGAGVAGAVRPLIEAKLFRQLEGEGAFQAVARFRAFGGPRPRVEASSNFFEALGAKPCLGRVLDDADAPETAVLSYDFWRTRFRADPQAVGRSFREGPIEYKIAGVMPRQFWYPTPRIAFYSRLEQDKPLFRAIGLLKPGATPASAQRAVRAAARAIALRIPGDYLELLPAWQDPRRQNAMLALALPALGACIGLIFLMLRGMGGFGYRVLLGARLFFLLCALCLLETALLGPASGYYGSYSLFLFWIFLLVCCAAGCLLARDHCGRCLVCYRKLRLPAPIGVWSSPIIDQPGTEYACPAGHGTLYVAGTENGPEYWTALDESWQELFVDRR